MPEALKKFMQLTKVDVARNLIYGVFTAEVLDKSGEVADYETSKEAFKVWSADCEKMSGGKIKGNVRKMHTSEIAGGVVSIDFDDVKKFISGCVEVKPDIAQEAAKGWLNGFSIGGSYAKKWEDPVHKGKMRFTPILAEISVVDNPCVPDATFEAFKDAAFSLVQADGTEEMRKFSPKPEDDVKTVFKAKDGTLHETIDLAMQKNAELVAADKPASPVDEKLKQLEDLAKGNEKKTTEDPVKKPTDLIKLEKGMYDVARCAQIVADLEWLACSVTEEAAWEEDDSAQPMKLKAILKTLCGFLRDMVAEETKEITATSKAFDGISEVSVLALRKISGKEEMFKDWKPSEPEPDKSAVDLAKITAERDDLKKTIDAIPAKIDAAIAGISKRLKDLEQQPATGSGPLFIVEKEKGIGDVTPVISRSLTPADFRKF